jgi:hypothetical protein
MDIILFHGPGVRWDWVDSLFGPKFGASILFLPFPVYIDDQMIRGEKASYNICDNSAKHLL